MRLAAGWRALAVLGFSAARAYALTACGSYFSCRHGYEGILIAELGDAGEGASIVAPGLVSAPRSNGLDLDGAVLDPVYALQALPEAVAITGETAAALGAAVRRYVEGSGALDGAARGSLAIHPLVPDLFKGAPKPRLADRCGRACEDAARGLRKRFAAARSPSAGEDPAESVARYALQVLLLSPTAAAVSLRSCEPVPHVGGAWPDARPGGLASEFALAPSEKIWTGDMPGSAYRKLLESLDCCGASGSVDGAVCVDLGACPGSWTAALLKLGAAKVFAVDRSNLAPDLMADGRVAFAKGDAFAFEPPVDAVDLLVSDVIAYPDRILKLVEDWCGAGRCERAIVTMKFRGDAPDLDALNAALRAAEDRGYAARAKHFFSNKNEVTLMLRRRPRGKGS